MNIFEWDHEADQIDSCLQALENHSEQFLARPCPDLLEKRNELAQSEENLFAAISQLRQFTSHYSKQKPEDYSLLYWANDLTQKIHDLVSKTRVLFADLFWLKIINQSINSASTESKKAIQLRSNDLEILHQQFSQIQKAKSFLDSQIAQINQDRERLTKKYDASEIKKSNQEAASTLNRKLGKSVKEAQFEPAVVSMDQFLRANHSKNKTNSSKTALLIA